MKPALWMTGMGLMSWLARGRDIKGAPTRSACWGWRAPGVCRGQLGGLRTGAPVGSRTADERDDRRVGREDGFFGVYVGVMLRA